MKKALLILVTALALLAIVVIPVIAGGPKAPKGERGRSGKAGKPNVGDVYLGSTDDGGPPEGKGWRRDRAGKSGKTGPAGNSNVAHLYLHEKVPSGEWPIVEGGAWGKMKYNLEGPTFDFVFNGHGLEPDEDYTLIYYPDPWPGTGLKCLGSAEANGGGNVHIQGSENTGDLPIEADANAAAKIWLVLSDDVDCDKAKMIAWNPTEYLFEYDLITYDDTDD